MSPFNITKAQWDSLIGRVNNMERINGIQATELELLEAINLSLITIVKFTYANTIVGVNLPDTPTKADIEQLIEKLPQ